MLEDNVELRLFPDDGKHLHGGAWSNDDNRTEGGDGDVELVLQVLDELQRVDEGQLRDVVVEEDRLLDGVNSGNRASTVVVRLGDRLNIYGCTMDDKVWEHPKEWRPERFLDEN
ncbi:hypothetical protein RJ639_011763 [Escallonia herrerae]|uniref:Uncharacterized protein n=1 Tax=Escallonia herrerae TaxID=1293975 RepID=A0AA88VRI6_9ASTE|nr:hypothetical protein RJ639_011763 [Escallonia herrerae]